MNVLQGNTWTNVLRCSQLAVVEWGFILINKTRRIKMQHLVAASLQLLLGLLPQHNMKVAGRSILMIPHVLELLRPMKNGTKKCDHMLVLL